MTTLGANQSSRSTACRKDFNINGYENWLPCHNHCNQAKGSRTSEFVPGIKKILDRLREKAQVVERVADSIALNIAKDKVFKTLFAALEEQTITVIDLDQLLEAFVRDPAAGGVPDDVIILDSGRWVKRENIVHEGTCRCERQACVGRKNKVYCYFEAGPSPWVVNKGLCGGAMTSSSRARAVPGSTSEDTSAATTSAANRTSIRNYRATTPSRLRQL